MNFSKTIACGEFVKRQTPESGYSHFNGSWSLLETIATRCMELYPHLITPGYRDGVVLLELPDYHAYNFSTAIVKLDDKSKLTSSFAPRRPGEDPFIRVSAQNEKQRAVFAQLVLYRHDVLAENNERQTDAEWEIVAIKARVDAEEEPMDPYTMARNFLHMKGGTKGDFTAEQFAKSIVYWNTHCMTTGKPKWYKKVMQFLRQIQKFCKGSSTP